MEDNASYSCTNNLNPFDIRMELSSANVTLAVSRSRRTVYGVGILFMPMRCAALWDRWHIIMAGFAAAQCTLDAENEGLATRSIAIFTKAHISDGFYRTGLLWMCNYRRVVKLAQIDRVKERDGRRMYSQ